MPAYRFSPQITVWNHPHFIFAFEQMGRRGIDRRINGSRGRFILNEVKLEGETIYERRDRSSGGIRTP